LVFWAVTPCGLVRGYHSEEHTASILLQPGRWRQCVPPKRWYLPTIPHGVTAQKTTVACCQETVPKMFIGERCEQLILLFIKRDGFERVIRNFAYAEQTKSKERNYKEIMRKSDVLTTLCTMH
jgi:hypothetical protein